VTTSVLNKALGGGCGWLDTTVTLSLGNDPWEWAIPRRGVELMAKKTSLLHGIRLRYDDHLFPSLITIIFGAAARLRLRLPHCWGFFVEHLQLRQRHTLVGLLWTIYQLIAEGATYTTHNKQNRRTSMSSAGFEPAIPAIERLQTYVLDCAATESAA